VTEILERRAVISGAGQSDIGRRLHRDPLDLTLDACLAAIADAGLDRSDIDGLATYPGAMETPPGFSGAGVTEVQDALRLNLNWYAGGLEAPGQLGSVINACLAVASGLVTHVLCFRTVWEGSAQGEGGRAAVMPGAISGGPRGGAPRVGGFMQWRLPYGAPSAANWIAMMASRHFHEFGTTREQLAGIALNGRRNAAANPKAIYTAPMTLEDYLSVRMVSWSAGRPCTWRRSAPPSTGGRRGTSGRTSRRWRCATPPRRCGRARTSRRPTSTWPSCTTASVSSPCAGSRRWAFAPRASRVRSWKAPRASPATVSCH
jgi:acetyl-CoA acetyltransferase